MTDTAQVAYGFENPRPLPGELPLRELTPLDMAFSTLDGHLHNGGAYLSYYDGQCKLVPREFKDKASALFFRGGKLADHGLRIRDGLDQTAVMANLHALLSSFGPKHEEKEATVGFALMKWCEPVE